MFKQRHIFHWCDNIYIQLRKLTFWLFKLLIANINCFWPVKWFVAIIGVPVVVVVVVGVVVAVIIVVVVGGVGADVGVAVTPVTTAETI